MSNNTPVNGWPQLKDLEAVQPILNRLDKIEAWKRTVKEETFTGDDITIENALALPARSLITEINAIQDLHGLPFPYVGGAYKNKLPMTVASIKAANTDGTWTGNTYAINNGTVEILTDNDSNIIGYKVNGTFNVATTFKVGVPTGGNILNGCPSGGSWESYLMYQSNGAVDTGSGGSGVITTANVVISVASGYNASNLIFRPMTRATDASADFAPWENKCPISGRTEVVLTRSDGDEISEDFTIQLGTTVYGAVINWDTGVASVLNAMIALNSKSWGGSNGNFYTSNFVADIKCNDGRYDHCISDRFMSENQPTLARLSDGGMSVDNSGYIQIKCSAYPTSSDFVTAMGDAQLCYELATPTTIQLTATQLEMLKGYNCITLTDGYGTIELKALTGANWS